MAERPIRSAPDDSFERQAAARGHRFVCGVDEVGRGPLAGPVVAAAVILDLADVPVGLCDSKALSEARRETCHTEIINRARAVCIVAVPAPLIDSLNIRAASLLAMTRAVRGLPLSADFALIDGNARPNDLPCDAETIVKGDARSVSIAAASIVAKVTRDRMMRRAEDIWPGYGFAGHKGYPTAAHRDALQSLGPCPIHRRSFAPVREAAAN